MRQALGPHRPNGKTLGYICEDIIGEKEIEEIVINNLIWQEYQIFLKTKGGQMIKDELTAKRICISQDTPPYPEGKENGVYVIKLSDAITIAERYQEKVIGMIDEMIKRNVRTRPNKQSPISQMIFDAEKEILEELKSLMKGETK